MGLSVKFAIWLISFPINFFIVTGIFIMQYITAVFNMPFDIWDEIEGEEDFEEDA